MVDRNINDYKLYFFDSDSLPDPGEKNADCRSIFSFLNASLQGEKLKITYSTGKTRFDNLDGWGNRHKETYSQQ